MALVFQIPGWPALLNTETVAALLYLSGQSGTFRIIVTNSGLECTFHIILTNSGLSAHFHSSLANFGYESAFHIILTNWGLVSQVPGWPADNRGRFRSRLSRP